MRGSSLTYGVTAAILALALPVQAGVNVIQKDDSYLNVGILIEVQGRACKIQLPIPPSMMGYFSAASAPFSTARSIGIGRASFRWISVMASAGCEDVDQVGLHGVPGIGNQPADLVEDRQFQTPVLARVPDSRAPFATIRYEFAYDGGGLGKGGNGTLFVNGQKVAEGRIEHTQCCGYSADEGADVGMDEATPVTEDYKERDNTDLANFLQGNAQIDVTTSSVVPKPGGPLKIIIRKAGRSMAFLKQSVLNNAA